MSALVDVGLVEPSNPIDAARFEIARADCAKVAAAGWKICHYQGTYSGHNFVGWKPGIRIRGEKFNVDVLALQHLLNKLIEYDEQNPVVVPRIERADA